MAAAAHRVTGMARLLTRAPIYQSSAERRVVEALLDQLSEDWVIAHSVAWVRSSEHDRSDRECDIVALSPSGLVTIEVKGGRIRRNGANAFTSIDRHGKEHPLKRSPVRQALEAKYLLKKSITSMHIVAGSYAHAVVFPDTDASVKISGHPLGLDLEGGVLIDGQALTEIGSRVSAPVSTGYAEPFSPPEFDRICELLEPNWELGGDLGLEVTRNESTIERLTAEQHLVMQGLWGNPRVVISGCAGSGKSILALRMACERAGSGEKALYVCFNRPLAEHQARIALTSGATTIDPGKVGAPLRITTFHQLVEDWLDAEGVDSGPKPGPKNADDLSDFFDREVALAADQTAIAEGFDTIIVDEGQDFEQEWVDLLTASLVDSSSSTFYLFMDPAQNIYRSDELPDVADSIPFTLNTNCRSAATLAESIAEILGDEPPNSHFEGGSPVEIFDCESIEKADDQLRKLVHRLLREDGLNEKDLVIQTMARPNTSRVWGTKIGNFTIAGRPIDSHITPALAPNEVRIETVRRFKGLETPATIIIETEAVEPDRLPNLLRVGLTRATTYAAWIRVKTDTSSAGRD